MWDSFLQFWLDSENVAFLIFAIFAIGGAVLMISHTKVVHMVTALGFTFFSLAGLYVLLHAEFVAFVQVLIYTGAVTILMIFGIMMTRHDEQEKEPHRPAHQWLVLLGVIGLFCILFYAIQGPVFPIPEETVFERNTEAIGTQLFTLHVIPFELVSLLLTVAFIGAIIIAKREED